MAVHFCRERESRSEQGREGGKEGGREGGRERGREGEREGEREGGRQAERMEGETLETTEWPHPPKCVGAHPSLWMACRTIELCRLHLWTRVWGVEVEGRSEENTLYPCRRGGGGKKEVMILAMFCANLFRRLCSLEDVPGLLLAVLQTCSW